MSAAQSSVGRALPTLGLGGYAELRERRPDRRRLEFAQGDGRHDLTERRIDADEGEVKEPEVLMAAAVGLRSSPCTSV